MYFLVALGCTIIAAVLWFFFKDRKSLRLDVLTITFGASTLMWLIDCIASAIKGEGFLTLVVDQSDAEAVAELAKDGWVALATVLGGIFFWLVVSFILNNRNKDVVKA